VTGLRPRELEIAALAAEGHTNAAIGRQLHITEDAVKTHLHRAMTQLGAVNRAHLVALILKADTDPHCACCRAHQVLDTRRSLRGRTGDAHPWSRLYDDIRTALTDDPPDPPRSP
jgi:DNA-binding CsgD family transcriptional regulator